jgi:hypothetical protein
LALACAKISDIFFGFLRNSLWNRERIFFY